MLMADLRENIARRSHTSVTTRASTDPVHLRYITLLSSVEKQFKRFSASHTLFKFSVNHERAAREDPEVVLDRAFSELGNLIVPPGKICYNSFKANELCSPSEKIFHVLYYIWLFTIDDLKQGTKEIYFVFTLRQKRWMYLLVRSFSVGGTTLPTLCPIC